MTTTTKKPALQVGALYLGDNGRCFCAAHAGHTAQMTGRDLSGQRVHKISESDQAYARQQFGRALACESCSYAKEAA